MRIIIIITFFLIFHDSYSQNSLGPEAIEIASRVKKLFRQGFTYHSILTDSLKIHFFINKASRQLIDVLVIHNKKDTIYEYSYLNDTLVSIKTKLRKTGAAYFFRDYHLIDKVERNFFLQNIDDFIRRGKDYLGTFKQLKSGKAAE